MTTENGSWKLPSEVGAPKKLDPTRQLNWLPSSDIPALSRFPLADAPPRPVRPRCTGPNGVSKIGGVATVTVSAEDGAGSLPTKHPSPSFWWSIRQSKGHQIGFPFLQPLFPASASLHFHVGFRECGDGVGSRLSFFLFVSFLSRGGFNWLLTKTAPASTNP